MATITESLSEDNVIPDDVLIEILLQLPLPSLYLFKSVSKHWLSLINSPYFIRRLQKPRIDTPCGLFIRKHKSKYYDFVTMGPKITSSPLRAIIAKEGSGFDIMQSCNGLLLCRTVVSSLVYYYVYNPFTKIFKNIPFAREPYYTNMMLVFDPTKSPYYKIVITAKDVYLKWDWGEDWEQYWEGDWEEDWEEDREEDWEEDREADWEEDWEEDHYTEQIQIYSSETGKWRICGPPFHEDMFRGFKDGIYWNNAIHWIHYDDYDDELPLHSKFDIVDHPMVTNIQTPTFDNVAYEHTKLFESRGSLILLMRDYDYCYHIFEMREESSEWSVKYIVDDLINIVPYEWMYSCFLFTVLGEKGDDSFMVLQSYNKIVRYNFVSKTVSTLCNFIHSYNPRSCIPFVASLASV